MQTAKQPDIFAEARRYEGAAGVARVVGVVGLIGLGAAVGLNLMGTPNWPQFLRAYLTAYCYFLSLALGGLFFVMLQHVTRAGWSVVVRRLAEFIAGTIPLMAILVIPILAGIKQLYPWADLAHTDDAGERALIEEKQSYLNQTFFIIRIAGYFVIWSLLAHYFTRRSIEQDASGDPNLTTRMQRLSAPGMLLFAFSVTFAAFDLLKTLTPTWFSTIFGVYYFAGSTVSFFALLILLSIWVQSAGRLKNVITTEHYHDMGKFMFAFVVFWAYIAFSQYMLQWYANMPEETAWYLARQTGGWAVVSWTLLFGHFVAPFLFLISRIPKRSKGPLALGAVWILVIHYVDLFWIVMPPEKAELVALSPPLPIPALAACFVGIGGLFLAALFMRMGKAALVPERDPRLSESLAFENY